MISEQALDRLTGMLRAPDLSGTRYEILGELGRGGMGIVYLARDTALDREIALKIVDRGAAGTRSDSPDALAHEARILARLEHPGIVPVHDFGELPDGRVYYAMKRVRGDRLNRWVSAGRDVAERLAVFLRICDAVAFAHAHAVVHRDLKPENVMIGEFGEVLVLYWGIRVNAERGLRNTEDDVTGDQSEPDSALTIPDSAFPIPHSALDSALDSPPPTPHSAFHSALRTPHSALDSALRTPHSAFDSALRTPHSA